MRERHQEIKFYNSNTYRNRVRQRTEMHITLNKIVQAYSKLINAYNSFLNQTIKLKVVEHEATGIKYLVK